MRYLAIVIFLAGCSSTSIDMRTPPPEDWPKLRNIYFDATPDELKRECASGALACAKAYFADRVCHIWLSTRIGWVVEHEEQHCLGRDHKGESTIRDAWYRWRLRNYGY